MEVPILEGEAASPAAFRDHIHGQRRPVVLRGLQLGPCVHKWTDPDYLVANVPDDLKVKVHVTKDANMDFRAKNFRYSVLPLSDVFRLTQKQPSTDGDGELYYLRDVGQDARGRDVARMDRDFPKLWRDFCLAPCFLDCDRLFSSVLRVSSAGVRVWTHYDVMDNLYAQVVGRKRAVLWPPDQALNLYLDGDKSRVIDIDNADPEKFPLFSQATKYEVDLRPGDVLFIPSMWFHNMTATDGGIGVNLFWKNLPDELYDKKDVYANRDLLPGAKALRMLDNVIRQLDDLPEELRDFYGRQLMIKIDKKCLSQQSSRQNGS